jgi:hypothetical protein
MGRKKKQIDKDNCDAVLAYITRIENAISRYSRKGNSKSEVFQKACENHKFEELYSELKSSVAYRKGSMIDGERLQLDFAIQYVSENMEDQDTAKMWTSLRKEHSNYSCQITLQNTSADGFNSSIESLMSTFDLSADDYTQSEILQASIETLRFIGHVSDEKLFYSKQLKRLLDDRKIFAYRSTKPFKEAMKKCITVLIEKGLDEKGADLFLNSNLITDMNKHSYKMIKFIEHKQHNAVLKVLNAFGEMRSVKHDDQEGLNLWFKGDAPSLSLGLLEGFDATNISGYKLSDIDELSF